MIASAKAKLPTQRLFNVASKIVLHKGLVDNGDLFRLGRVLFSKFPPRQQRYSDCREEPRGYPVLIWGGVVVAASMTGQGDVVSHLPAGY